MVIEDLSKTTVSIIELTNNSEVVDACRVTVWKDGLGKEPSEVFMNKIYKSEHSPIREKWFVIKIQNIPYWLSTHFARHSIGYTPYISTQRDDRIEYETTRGERGQGEAVNMRITLNAQAIINVSRKRKCEQAHDLAIELWEMVLEHLKPIDEPLFNNSVVECVYRGFCPEMNCCGYIAKDKCKQERRDYIKGFPRIII